MPKGKRVTRKKLQPAPKKSAPGNGTANLTLRVNFGAQGALGPGKIRLLELIGQHGSISVAGRAMAMSYLRAWKLVDSLNTLFDETVVATQRGGVHGGGAELTAFGRQVVEAYRCMEHEAMAAAMPRLLTLQKSLSRRGAPAAKA